MRFCAAYEPRVSTGALVIVARSGVAVADPRRDARGREASGAKRIFARFGRRRHPSEAQPTAPRTVTRERVELPPERRLSPSTLAGLAAAAGIAAIVLGGWAFVSGVGRDDDGASRSAAPPSGFRQAVALLARPDAERLPLRGAVGRIILVVQPSDDAALVLSGLGEAESGWAYQAWVTNRDSITPRSAGLFSGRDIVVPLSARVPPGSTVAVTLEPATGSFAPTRRPKLVVERPLPSTRAQGARARDAADERLALARA